MVPLRRGRLAAACAATLVAALWPAASASAETFVVDSLKDAIDPEPTNDVCATAAGECTLRAAIETANHFVGNDEIKLPKGTIELKLPKEGAPSNAEGDLDVTEAVEIDGRGPSKSVIKQTVKDRVLRNDAAFTGFCCPGLQLSDITLTGGRVGGAGENGGAGLQNNEFALVSNVVIRNNVANSDAFDDVPAGGVWSSGIIGLAETTVRDNVARGRGEAHPEGGGVYIHDGSATIQDGSKVIGNAVELRKREGDVTAQAGGILVRNPGSEPDDVVTILDSTVAGNTALGAPIASAGGISAGPGANLQISGSTLSGNRSRQGGGLHAVGVALVGITNSTISGNSDAGDGGAAIFHQAGPGVLGITHTTIAENRPSAGHVSIEQGEQGQPGSLTLFASIVANRGAECGDNDGIGVESDGRNVVGDMTCDFDEALFDLDANPKLKPLADNGGRAGYPHTRTHALMGSSPAINRVPCSPGVDQRGFGRPSGTDCDSGSFERGASPLP
jgi:large repetitive protein